MNAATLPPKPITSTATGCTTGFRTRSLLFMPEWHFLPEGVRDVETRVGKSLDEKGLFYSELRYDSENELLRIICASDVATEMYHSMADAFNDIIKEEEEKNGIFDNGETNEQPFSDSVSDGVSSGEEDLDLEVDENAPIKSTKIQRLAHCLARQNCTRGVLPSQFPPSPIQSNLEYPLAVSAAKEKSIWSCPKHLDLDMIIPDTTLEKLINLTGCQMIKALNDGVIFIGAGSEESVHLALSKLDVIQKYSRISLFVAHAFYTEEIGNCELSLKRLNDVKIHKKRMFETTLLAKPYQLEEARRLERVITIRCALHDDDKGGFTPVKIKDLNINEYPKFHASWSQWEGYKFSERGQIANDPLRHIPEDVRYEPPKSSATPSQPPQSTEIATTREIKDHISTKDIENWQNNVSAKGPVETEVQVLKASIRVRPAWDPCEGSDEPPQLPESTFDRRPVALQNMAARAGPRITSVQHRTAVSLNTMLTSSPTMVQHLGSNSQAGTRKTSIPLGFPPLSRPPKAQLQTRSNVPIPEHTQTPCQANMGANIDTIAAFSLQENVGTYHSNHTANQQLNSSPQKLTPPSLSNTLERTLLDDDISNLDSFAPIPFTHAIGNERLQARSEVETREYHNIMNLKAKKPAKGSSQFTKSVNTKGRLPLPGPIISPKKKSSHKSEPLIDPLPEFARELHEDFARLIEDARGFRGDLTVEAEFGRILISGIKNTHIAEKDQKNHSVSLDNFKRLLSPRSEHKGAIPPITFFTNKLTTVPAEIDDLLSVKNTFDAQSLWEEQQSGWSISYSLTYIDVATKAPFIIEFDAESFVPHLKLHRSYGSVYIHGTKRAWDCRITAHGSERDEETEERYDSLISKLQQAIYIPADKAEPQLDFQLDQATHERFLLDSIHVHKISQHMSKDEKSILKLTEVLELNTHWKLIEDKSIVVCRARYSQAQDPKVDNRWFTAAIESVQGKEFLRQNERLKLGEEAGWTSYSFEQAEVVEALVLPACEMLKHMDGIGYHNSNGIARSTPAPSLASLTTPSKPYYFW